MATRKKRKRNLRFHYAVTIILVLIVGAVLSTTVFFKITEIHVEGEVPYDPQMIIDCSNIKVGDNLWRANTNNAKKKIMQQLVYVDSVEIKRVLPSKIKIIVTKSEPYLNVLADGEYLLVSTTGKILNSMRNPEPDLYVIKGFEPVATQPGEMLKSEDKAKDKLIKNIYESIKYMQIQRALEFDITDRFNIKMFYDNRITVEIGNQNDLEYKIKYARTVIENEISPKKEGTLFMLNENEISFIEKADLEKFYKDYENAKTSVPEEESDEENENTEENDSDNPSENE